MQAYLARALVFLHLFAVLARKVVAQLSQIWVLSHSLRCRRSLNVLHVFELMILSRFFRQIRLRCIVAHSQHILILNVYLWGILELLNLAH